MALAVGGVAMLGLFAVTARAVAALGAGGGRGVAVFGVFACCYVALLLAALLSSNSWSGFQARYSIPVYLPFVVVAALILDRLLARAGRATTPLPRAGLVLVLAVALPAWLALQVKTQVELRGNRSLGYGDLRAVPILGEAQRVGLTGTVFSNDIALVYLNVGSSARHRHLPCAGANAIRSQLLAANALGPAYVLWFRHRAGRAQCLRAMQAVDGWTAIANTPAGLLARF